MKKKIEKDGNDFRIGFESQILALFDSSPFNQKLKIQSFPLGMLILKEKKIVPI